MWGPLLEDLRFVIGLFFAIIAALLLWVGTFDPQPQPGDLHLNLRVGALMALFAAFMIAISFFFPAEDAHT